MSDDTKWKRLKGALGNAFVFAAGWTVAAFVCWVLLRQARLVPPLSVLDGIGMSIRFGFMGFITGAVFPTFMRIAYRGKRLSEISWVRFGLVGAIVTGLFVPAFMQTMNILSGDGMVALRHIAGDIFFTAAFGGAAAALSLRLAQYAATLFPETFQHHLDRLERMTELTAGEGNISTTQRSRSADYVGLPPRDP